MFGKNMKIGEGEKYDITQISKDGVTAEELAEIEKKNKKLIDIYKALGANEKGLSKLDLAMAMDGFVKHADADGDGKLSKKELNKYAEVFKETYGVEVKGKDLKAFIKSVVNAGKGDVKADTAGVIDEHNQQEKLKADVDTGIKMFLNDLDEKAKLRAEAEAKAKAEAEAKAKAEAERKADLAKPKDYTVQPNEKLESILTRSLEAQGIEVNEENLAKAKEEFIKNNPKALHGPKGNEYLYQGDVIKVPGNLEDKGNADEIKGAYRKKQDEIKAAEEEKARLAEEAKLRAADEEKAKAVEEAKAKAAAKQARLNQALEDLSPSSRPSNEGQLPYNHKIEKMTKENKELLDEIAKGDNPSFAARALMAASKGSGTNDVLFEAVLGSAQNKEYFQEIDKVLKTMGTSVYKLARYEYLSKSPVDVSDNKYYQEYVRDHWQGK